MSKTVAWIGLGVMGEPMAGHLLAAGYPLRVHTRTKEKAARLIESGAEWCNTPKAAATGSSLVFSIVGYPSDVEEVILGETGALAGAEPGATLVEMTTSEPALAQRIHAEAAAKGVGALDAP